MSESNGRARATFWIALAGIAWSVFVFATGWLSKAAQIEWRVAELEKSKEKVEFQIVEQGKAVSLDHQALLDVSVDMGQIKVDVRAIRDALVRRGLVDR